MPLGEPLYFLQKVWALAHVLETASRGMQRRLGVTGAQRFVIRIVGQHPQVSAGELADLLHVHPSTVTSLLEKLERRRIISRLGDPEDGRRSLFTLTAHGRTLNRTTTGTIEAQVGAALRALSSAQVRTAVEVFEALTSALDIAQPRSRVRESRKR
jgi:DNA-binding MarR family transcriptional regulator